MLQIKLFDIISLIMNNESKFDLDFSTILPFHISQNNVHCKNISVKE